MNEKFKEVKSAYKMLRSFIEESNKQIIRNSIYNKEKSRKKNLLAVCRIKIILLYKLIKNGEVL
jgi:hypothetical protein